MAEVVVEPLFGAEQRLPGGRVQTVRTEHHGERAPAAPAEGHVDPVAGLVEGGDGVAEHELHVVTDRRVQGVGQIPAPHLQVPPRDTAGDVVRVERGHFGAVALEEGQPAQVDVRVPQPRQDPHPADDLQCGAAHVDGVTTAAERGRLFDHRDRVSVAVQPERQGGTRDTGPEIRTSGLGTVPAPAG
ncbi:hypothetical protein GCM10023238_14860 [Streptomyces heliomycini]